MKYITALFAAASLMAEPVLADFSGGTVKIGVLNDQSSLYAAVSGQGSVFAARLAVEDFQRTNKDVKVEILFADHENKPDTGSEIVRGWIETGQVDAIADVINSSVALSVNEIVREQNKVFLASGAATSDLTGSKCSPNTVHWTYDTWALTQGMGKAIVKTGGDSWFFVTADYAFGHALERDMAAAVQSTGGKVLGAARHPLNTPDFSSFLLQAQASKAKVIALANVGADTVNAVKQAAEFGIVTDGQNLVGAFLFITDVHSLGLWAAQGLIFTESFYWDLNDGTRAWSKRFAALNKERPPSMVHAGVYGAVLHYLKAVATLKSDEDGKAVVAQMKRMPTDDPLFGRGSIRSDGRKIHPMYVFEVKKPSESSRPWDYYKVRATIPAGEAFRPLDQGNCPLR